MPQYKFRCQAGHDTDIIAPMDNHPSLVACSTCGTMARRVWAMPRVNWNGLPPSAGDLHPNLKRELSDAERNRDRLQAKQETT